MTDIEKCKIEFQTTTPGNMRRIMIDDIEWGTVHSMPNGRHGSKFIFKDVSGGTVRYPQPRGRPATPHQYYTAYAKNNREIDSKLVAAVTAMVQAGDLGEPDKVRQVAMLRNAERQRRTNEANAEKRAAWEARATQALEAMHGYALKGGRPHPADVNAIIEAMEWAQAQ